MAEITRELVARVGVDLSKRVFQVHAVDRAGRQQLAKAMSPQRFYAWCAELPAGCMVAMEACGGAHHVARRVQLLIELSVNDDTTRAQPASSRRR